MFNTPSKPVTKGVAAVPPPTPPSNISISGERSCLHHHKGATSHTRKMLKMLIFDIGMFFFMDTVCVVVFEPAN